MNSRMAALIVFVCICGLASAQVPDLSRSQRELLGALITAADAAVAMPPSDDSSLRTHLLRASDGSHYVAFSVERADTDIAAGPLLLYVRLATARAPGSQAAREQSLVRDWLRGSRVDPRLLAPKRGFAVGDMPAMGAGTAGTRGATAVGSADLQILELQRERERRRKADQEKQRRAELEGAGTTNIGILPFEDFEIVNPAAHPDGRRLIERALTAGPGTYHLIVAWADATQPARTATIQVRRHALRLGPATPEFGLSTIIIADEIRVRETPYSALEQRAHPYAIGATEIAPAREAVFTSNEHLMAAFQIINPTPSASGHPDVLVNLRIVRAASRDEPVATLSPLTYNVGTLPGDFNVRLGHPLIAAMSAPLATIRRGNYRLLITAEDRQAGIVAAGRAEFRVVGTPSSLLAEAPPLGASFETGAVLREGVLSEVLDRLTLAAPSARLAAALHLARSGQFAHLLVADTVPQAEQGIRAALSGIALLSLGNPSATAEFQRALLLQAPLAPVQFLLAAARALERRDHEAIAAWEAARSEGWPAATVDALIAEAYLRQKDFARAAAVIGAASANDPVRLRTFAATRIAINRPAEAIAALDGLLASHAGDQRARWLLLHALYADFVGNNRERRQRLLAEARRYIDDGGEHAALAAEWLAIVNR